jgi:hypothetical protein
MNSDFKDLLKLFNTYKVRYLIVGGHAVMKYTEPRYTKDLDIQIGRGGSASGSTPPRVGGKEEERQGAKT